MYTIAERSLASRPPSKRSRSSLVSPRPRKPAYTVAITIAPTIPPQRAAATSTPASSLRLRGAPPPAHPPETSVGARVYPTTDVQRRWPAASSETARLRGAGTGAGRAAGHAPQAGGG